MSKKESNTQENGNNVNRVLATGLKNQYIVVNSNKHPYCDSINGYRYLAIKQFEKYFGIHWVEAKKLGYKVIKVNIIFEPCC